MVASEAMLLATDALSSQRTTGFYMLSVCDWSESELADFAQFHGSWESLLTFAMAYDTETKQLLYQRVFGTSVQHNVTQLLDMMYDGDFFSMCINLTRTERRKLTLKWGDDMEVFILIIDYIREHVIIPSILQVKALISSHLMHCHFR